MCWDFLFLKANPFLILDRRVWCLEDKLYLFLDDSTQNFPSGCGWWFWKLLYSVPCHIIQAAVSLILPATEELSCLIITPEDSLPYSQNSAIRLYPVADYSSPNPQHLIPLKCVRISSSTSRFSKWHFPFIIPSKMPHLFLPSTRRATYPTHLISFNGPKSFSEA